MPDECNPLLARGRDRLETSFCQPLGMQKLNPLLARGRDRLETILEKVKDTFIVSIIQTFQCFFDTLLCLIQFWGQPPF